MTQKQTITYAKKTFLAIENPFNTVENVCPLAIEKLQEETFLGYFGVKNHTTVSEKVVTVLEENGYALHTYDSMSLGGRAVDQFRLNPITLRPMTGSSSGTALNVFYGINDIGIGTDGGGSVLNPALSLNLTAFISKHLDLSHSKKFSRTSTDGITFSPSNGIISRDYDSLLNVAKLFFEIGEEKPLKILIPNEDFTFSGILAGREISQVLSKSNVNHQITCADFSKITGNRREQIDFMENAFADFDMIISPEGPTDLHGMGDTVFGSMDETTAEIQSRSGKALSKVANMVDSTAVIIPTERLAYGYLLSVKKAENISTLFQIAKPFERKRNPLLESYFLNHNNHFQSGLRSKNKK